MCVWFGVVGYVVLCCVALRCVALHCVCECNSIHVVMDLFDWQEMR